MFDLGPYFGRDDVTDDVIIESSECLGKFRKYILVTLPQGFCQIFRCFAVRTKFVLLMTKYTPLYRRRVKTGHVFSKYILNEEGLCEV